MNKKGLKNRSLLFSKIKIFFLSILLVALWFFLLFTLFYNVIHCIKQFYEFNSMIMIYIAAFICLVLSFLFNKLDTSSTYKKGKFHSWINKHLMTIISLYMVVNICVYSISPDASWTIERINNILSTNWTMFGLALTIFFVWYVLIFNYLKEKQPLLPDNPDLIQNFSWIQKKIMLYHEIETTYATIVILSINLLALIISTGLVCLSNSPESVITQNFLRCTFFLSANSIILLFVDILKSINKNRTELKKANEVTLKEENDANTGYILQLIIEDRLKDICNSDNLSGQQKNEQINDFIISLRRAFQRNKSSTKYLDQFLDSKMKSIYHESEK